MDGPTGLSNQQVANTIQTIVLEVFNLFARPFVLVTRVLFHTELGERYFNEMQAALCMILIAAATLVSKATAGGFGVIIGIAWGAAFLYCTWEHFRTTVPNRYRNGIRWHSRSEGIPRLPEFSKVVQGIILAVATTLAFLIHLHGFGLLLLFSLMMSIMADLAAAKQFWNRMLDTVDGQIEAEELGKAIEQRLTPQQASGLNVCVPAYVSQESRRKMAAALNRSLGGPRGNSRVEVMPTESDAPIPAAGAGAVPTTMP